MKEVPEKQLSIGELFVVFFKSPRGKAILKLLVFFSLFLLIRIIDIKFGKNESPSDWVSSSSSSSGIIKENTYEEALLKLKSDDYSFLLVITNEEVITHVLGEKTEDKIIGYVNSINGNRFSIENNVVYNTSNGKKIVDENILNGVNHNYLNAAYIVNLIEFVEPEIKIENKVTVYLYKLTDQTITITFEKNIRKIEIMFLDSGVTYGVNYQSM